jgi:hypothetical protein
MITDPIFFSLSFKMKHYLPQTNRKGLHTLPVVPVMIYTNAETQKISILSENQGKSGVYRWINKENGNSYVGSAVNLSKRFAKYYSFKEISKGNMSINKASRRPRRDASHAARATLYWNMVILSLDLKFLSPVALRAKGGYCERTDAIEREQYYIDLLAPEYNILKTAGSSLGYKHTEETLAKLKGHKHTEETLAKMREVALGRGLGRKHSEETIAKISASTSASMLGRKHSEETCKKKNWRINGDICYGNRHRNWNN